MKPPPPVPADQTNISPFAREGLNLTSKIWTTFWQPKSQTFAAGQASADTVPPNHGYLLWPSTVAVQTIIEATRASPSQYSALLTTSIESLEVFYSKQYGAYCAWHNFPGNNDIYYDDNAQVAVAQVTAYQLTQNKTYLQRAIRVADFLVSGWDSSNNPGGMPWHLDRRDSRNTCSTSLAAIAFLHLSRVNSTLAAKYLPVARACISWVLTHLQNESSLIMDNIKLIDGHWKPQTLTWTYNTGSTLSALCLLYTLEPSSTTLQSATTLATAAIDHSKSMYDRSIPDPSLRYWWDSTFFTHLLTEGLLLFLSVFSPPLSSTQHQSQSQQQQQQQLFPQLAPSSTSLLDSIRAELLRQTEYLTAHIRDPADGLYFRNLRLYTIGRAHLEDFARMTGDTKRQMEPDAAERASGEGDVMARPLVKTLLGSAGVGRALLLVGEAGIGR
ncbi:hypothetical protein MMC06_001991 [Schaereria dolodes]|nr:hypothetical protein [Schaereria dolodes]